MRGASVPPVLIVWAVGAWEPDHNAKQKGVDWQFTTADTETVTQRFKTGGTLGASVTDTEALGPSR